jgi:DNA excision repair protein ERCC-4
MSVIRVPTVLIDTREQNPWMFKGRGVRLKYAALKFGDYAVQGSQSLLIVERKSVEDLFGTMTKGLERFCRELERARLAGTRVAVVVEGDVHRVSLGSRFSFGNPDRVVSCLYRTCAKWGAAPYFCDGRIAAESLAWKLLMGAWEAGRV